MLFELLVSVCIWNGTAWFNTAPVRCLFSSCISHMWKYRHIHQNCNVMVAQKQKQKQNTATALKAIRIENR